MSGSLGTQTQSTLPHVDCNCAAGYLKVAICPLSMYTSAVKHPSCMPLVILSIVCLSLKFFPTWQAIWKLSWILKIALLSQSYVKLDSGFIVLINDFFSVNLPQCQTNDRVECGYLGINEAQCLYRGCCWSPTTASGQPWCYYMKGNVFTIHQRHNMAITIGRWMSAYTCTCWVVLLSMTVS